MTTVNNFAGRMVTLDLVSPTPEGRKFIIGLASEIISQGVLMTYVMDVGEGTGQEVSAFFPWHRVAGMTIVGPIFADTQESTASVQCSVSLAASDEDGDNDEPELSA